ncbi:MAG: DUF1592 domain-containing protein [Bryobacteraceae bacterium]|nr:DUF1592 domain-containing protein [Bryobacteraceae bacterium]
MHPRWYLPVLLTAAHAATNPFVAQYCGGCHQGAKPAGGFAVKDLADDNQRAWSRVLQRVRDGDMPPNGAKAPTAAAREQFVSTLESTLRTAACADGIQPRPAPIRRLNRYEYGATLRDLLGIPIDAGHNLPADGAGGEGFDNAAETLFLSPLHAEKYLAAAKEGIDYGLKDAKSRAKFLTREPSAKLSAEDAAHDVIVHFLPRAFRRPATPDEVERYLGVFRRQKGSFDSRIAYTLQGILLSPHFLFRFEDPSPIARPVPDYALASRLSYFLWGSMPDDTLFSLAAQGKLSDPAVLREQAVRLLKDQKSRDFAENFVEQWLGTRELGRDIKPDAKLYPAFYDAEIQSGMRYEPILFFQELLSENLSLLNLLDSDFTFLTNKLQKHYGIKLEEKLRQQPKRVQLPPDTHRGGLLGMAAVLAVSSYPNRTSPVLRGKWILDAMLGTPSPPPPPNVPPLPAHAGETPTTLRARLLLHRQNPTCASCHNRLDPLGFALENYDVLGLWRTTDNGLPLDTAGELPDGTRFTGPEGLKQTLLARQDLFLRNLTTKLLGFALGRGLNREDACAVDQILGEVARDGYRGQTLIHSIVASVPFRQQPATAVTPPLKKTPLP